MPTVEQEALLESQRNMVNEQCFGQLSHSVTVAQELAKHVKKEATRRWLTNYVGPRKSAPQGATIHSGRGYNLAYRSNVGGSKPFNTPYDFQRLSAQWKFPTEDLYAKLKTAG
jgi:hypothetical protein